MILDMQTYLVNWFHSSISFRICNTLCGLFNMLVDTFLGGFFCKREFYGNNIRGKVPDELGNLTNVLSLDLYQNKLIGSIPETLKSVRTTTPGAVDNALSDRECYDLKSSDARMSCFVNMALVNVGVDLAKLVPGRVSTEVDARLAYDTNSTVKKVHDLLKLYSELEVPPERLLFKIPSTWQGIEASRLLESEGIRTHMTFAYSCQHCNRS